jgi:hypothetical protein
MYPAITATNQKVCYKNICFAGKYKNKMATEKGVL